MTEFEEVLETILEEYARRDTEGDFDTWEDTDSFVKEKAEVLLAYANLKKEPVSEELEKELESIDQSLFDLNGVAVKGATHFLTVEDVKDIAKHFFELGIKTAQKGE